MVKYQYLYGFTQAQIQSIETIPYKAALRIKIQAAKNLARTLNNTHYMARDNHRVTAILKAIDFNKSLIEELTWPQA